MIKNIIKYLPFAAVFFLAGCLESSFVLDSNSRLPKWFTLPQGLSRSDVKVTMDYYSYPSGNEAVFKIYNKNSFFSFNKAIGSMRELYPTSLQTSSTGYPAYEVITVNGVTDIIEHRKMEPVFYITDNPEIWKQLGTKQ